VAVIDPRDLGGHDVPLHLVVESARVDGRELALVNGAALPARTSDLQIDYTTTALSIADRVQFRYRLEGADTAWREVGTRRQAFYTALEPGSYRFLVSANRGDGQWEDANASWSFRVLPAWYQTASFRFLLVLTIAGVGGLLVWVVQRRRHLRAQAELERRYEITMAERSRIAEDLHDTLLQGFAGVNLQLIAAELALPAKPDVAAETIVRVQRLTEESLREARHRVWEMRDAAAPGDDLTTALETVARDRTANTPIEVAVTASGSSLRLPRDVEDAAFRIGREAIVNAVRHAKASRIELHLDYGASAFRLEVRDDGRGVDPIDAAEARDRGHFGLGNMQNRASLMGGRCEVKSRTGGGTVVSLELPLAATAAPHARRHRGDGYLEGGMPRTGAPS
jgi:signal transduction histidine kinase